MQAFSFLLAIFLSQVIAFSRNLRAQDAASIERILALREDDYYGIMNLDPSADRTAIRKAYRALSLSVHPDKNPQLAREANDAFQRVNNAYEVLSDPLKRQRYDRERNRYAGPQPNPQPDPPQGPDRGAQFREWGQQRYQQASNGIANLRAWFSRRYKQASDNMRTMMTRLGRVFAQLGLLQHMKWNIREIMNILNTVSQGFEKKMQDIAAGGKRQQTWVGRMKDRFRSRDFLTLQWFQAKLSLAQNKLAQSRVYFQNKVVTSSKWQKQYKFYTPWVTSQFQFLESTIQKTNQQLQNNQARWFNI